MNYDLDEVDRLLARLQALRDEAGDDRPDFDVFVIPNAEPTPELLERLGSQGVTSTMVMPWYPGDPAAATIEQKRAAMEATAARLGLG